MVSIHTEKRDGSNCFVIETMFDGNELAEYQGRLISLIRLVAEQKEPEVNLANFKIETILFLVDILQDTLLSEDQLEEIFELAASEA